MCLMLPIYTRIMLPVYTQMRELLMLYLDSLVYSNLLTASLSRTSTVSFSSYISNHHQALSCIVILCASENLIRLVALSV